MLRSVSRLLINLSIRTPQLMPLVFDISTMTALQAVVSSSTTFLWMETNMDHIKPVYMLNVRPKILVLL